MKTCRGLLGQYEGKGSSYFKCFFPSYCIALSFHKTNVLFMILKIDAINEFGIRYWLANPFDKISVIYGSFVCEYIQEKVNIGEKVLTFKKNNRVTKTAPMGQ